MCKNQKTREQCLVSGEFCFWDPGWIRGSCVDDMYGETDMIVKAIAGDRSIDQGATSVKLKAALRRTRAEHPDVFERLERKGIGDIAGTLLHTCCDRFTPGIFREGDDDSVCSVVTPLCLQQDDPRTDRARPKKLDSLHPHMLLTGALTTAVLAANGVSNETLTAAHWWEAKTAEHQLTKAGAHGWKAKAPAWHQPPLFMEDASVIKEIHARIAGFGSTQEKAYYTELARRDLASPAPVVSYYDIRLRQLIEILGLFTKIAALQFLIRAHSYLQGVRKSYLEIQLFGKKVFGPNTWLMQFLFTTVLREINVKPKDATILTVNKAVSQMVHSAAKYLTIEKAPNVEEAVLTLRKILRRIAADAADEAAVRGSSSLKRTATRVLGIIREKRLSERAAQPFISINDTARGIKHSATEFKDILTQACKAFAAQLVLDPVVVDLTAVARQFARVFVATSALCAFNLEDPDNVLRNATAVAGSALVIEQTASVLLQCTEAAALSIATVLRQKYPGGGDDTLSAVAVDAAFDAAALFAAFLREARESLRNRRNPPTTSSS